MRSEVAQRIIDETSVEIKNKVKEYGHKVFLDYINANLQLIEDRNNYPQSIEDWQVYKDNMIE